MSVNEINGKKCNYHVMVIGTISISKTTYCLGLHGNKIRFLLNSSQFYISKTSHISKLIRNNLHSVTTEWSNKWNVNPFGK